MAISMEGDVKTAKEGNAMNSFGPSSSQRRNSSPGSLGDDDGLRLSDVGCGWRNRVDRQGPRVHRGTLKRPA
jgi:hypothetical protein